MVDSGFHRVWIGVRFAVGCQACAKFFKLCHIGWFDVLHWHHTNG